MPNFNPNRGIDYHLRSLGFNNRAYLEVISMDNMRFANDRVVTKPDWVVRCKRSNILYVLDYKNRNAGSGPTKREMWQLLCYYWIVPLYLSWIEETDDIMTTRAGILFGDGKRYILEFSDNDLLQLQESVIPAIKAYRKLGLLRENQRISATFLADYMVDPTLKSRYVSSQQARIAGTAAHKAIVNPATYH